MKSAKIEGYLSENGVSLLYEIGVNETGLTRSNALKFLDLVKSENLAILGGDVYHQSNNSIQVTGDSWYINVRDYSNYTDCVRGSIAKAKEYILNYPDILDKSLLFVIVLQHQ